MLASVEFLEEIIAVLRSRNYLEFLEDSGAI